MQTALDSAGDSLRLAFELKVTVGLGIEVVEAVARGREEYAELGRELDLPALPSHTNFVSFDAGGAARARAILERLQAEGVFARVPAAPPLDRLLRVTVGTPPQRAELAGVLRRVLAGMASR